MERVLVTPCVFVNMRGWFILAAPSNMDANEVTFAMSQIREELKLEPRNMPRSEVPGKMTGCVFGDADT